MDTTGNTREGWMALIPLTVLILVVMYIAGGPEAFLHILNQWTRDVSAYVSDVIRYL